MDVYFAPVAKEIICIECEELRDLTNTTFAAITEVGEKYEKWLDEKTAKMDADEKAHFQESVTDHAFMLYDRHPARLIRACFLTAYCFLEDQFLELALMEGNAKQFGLDPFDLNKEGIDAARKYLHKACAYQIPATVQWERLLWYKRLRNAIVHNGSRCFKDTGLEPWVVKQEPDLFIDEHKRIRLTTTFCISAINDIEAFLCDVVDAITTE
jgi:hypothetical protein